MTDQPALELPLDTSRIREILPQRYPFLMIDRVTELEPGERIKAFKNISQNEPWTVGHFPDEPIMPGVMMIEVLAQAGAIMMLIQPNYHGRRAVLAGISKMRFRRIVRPGDVLVAEVELKSLKMGVGRAAGRLTVDGEAAVLGEIQFAFLDA